MIIRQSNFSVPDVIMMFIVFVECVVITWGLSGTSEYTSIAMALPAAALYVLSSFFRRPSNTYLARLMPWLLLLLLAVCAVQYFNYRDVVFTRDGYTGIAKTEYISWLPTSSFAEYYKGNPIRSAVDIGGALCLAISCCSLFEDKRIRNFTLISVVLNAALMGVFAMFQRHWEWPTIYNIFYTTGEFYGSFPLSNACSAFLNMAAAAAFSLSLYFWNRGRRALFLLSFVSVIALVLAVFASPSRGAAAMCAAYLASAALVLLLGRLFGMRVYLWVVSALMLVVCMLAPIFTYELYGPNLIHIDSKDSAVASLKSRFQMYEISKGIAAENPMWGVGGNSCQFHLSGEMVKKQDVSEPNDISTARHCHCDMLEYMAEFGLIGVIAILAAFVALMVDLAIVGMSAEAFLLFAGAAMCIFHSFFDIHLHIPSTMYLFGVVVVGALYTAKVRRR